MKIEIKNVWKKIGKTEVLKDINLEFNGGKIYGLKGKNGSGKTMLMRAICGLITVTKGEIIVNGKRLGKDISFPNSIGVLIENPSFIDNFSGYRNLKALADINHIIGEEEIKNVIKLVGLDPNNKKKFKTYSLGMKQKLGIAAAIMEKPELIILDEPSNALDEKSEEILWQIVGEEKERGALIIISCHTTETLEKVSDEIFRMDMGQIKEHMTV